MFREPDLASRHSAADVVRIARSWAGTPYHHQASCRGAGADCLGLVRGVWRELYRGEPEPLCPYSRDWSATGEETLLEAARRHLVEIDPKIASMGDVVVFRYRAGLPAKHCGILTNEAHFVHAVEGAPVCEVPFANWWRRRVAGTFRFPGVSV
jgi:NlpC/P60 family putative phage cell wall peptidase